MYICNRNMHTQERIQHIQKSIQHTQKSTHSEQRRPMGANIERLLAS